MNTRINSSVAKSVDKVIFSNFLKTGCKPLSGKFIPEASILENKTTLNYKIKNKGSYNQILEFCRNPDRFKKLIKEPISDKFVFAPKGLVGDIFQLSYLGIDFNFKLHYSVSFDLYFVEIATKDSYEQWCCHSFSIEKISELKLSIIRTISSVIAEKLNRESKLGRGIGSYENCFITEEPNSSSLRYGELKHGRWKSKTMRRRSYSIFKRFSTISVWPSRGVFLFEAAAIKDSHIRTGYTTKHAKWLKQHKSDRKEFWRKFCDSKDIFGNSNSIQKLSRRDRLSFYEFKAQVTQFNKAQSDTAELE